VDTEIGWDESGAMKPTRMFVYPLIVSTALSAPSCGPADSPQSAPPDTPATTSAPLEPVTTLPPVTTTTVPQTAVDPTIEQGDDEGDVPVDDAAVRIQAALDEALPDWPAPGLMLWVDTPEETIVATSGWADRDEQIPMQPDGPFYTGSITKMFVATVVMQLVEEGLIGLDDPLSNWFPEILEHPSGDRITVHHLLAHQSGIRYFGTVPEMRQALWGDGEPFDPRTIAETMIRDHPLEPTPGQFAYSNTNYLILGLLIEDVTGQPAEAIIRHRILDPLGLDHTYLATYEEPIGEILPTYSDFVAMDGSGGFINQHPVLDRVDPEFAERYFRTTWMTGGMVSTAPDLIVFVRALFEGRLFDDPATLETMRVYSGSDSEAQYGLGIMRVNPDGTEFLGHFGHSSGHVAGVIYSIEHDCAIVVMANSDAQSGDELIRLAYVGLMALEPVSP
jgi:D-alanyl-D-alanine carboxypeptidase